MARPVGDTGGAWVTYDVSTAAYRTGDGTAVAAELVDNAACLADFLYIAILREAQRNDATARRHPWKDIRS